MMRSFKLLRSSWASEVTLTRGSKRRQRTSHLVSGNFWGNTSLFSGFFSSVASRPTLAIEHEKEILEIDRKSTGFEGGGTNQTQGATEKRILDELGLDQLRSRTSTAASVIANVAQEIDSTNSGRHFGALQNSLQRLSVQHDVEIRELAEADFQPTMSSTAVIPEANEFDSSTSSNSSGLPDTNLPDSNSGVSRQQTNVIDMPAAFLLPKKEVPEPADDVALSFHYSTVPEMRNLAKHFGLPCSAPKFQLYSRILQYLDLPPDTLYITTEMLSSPHFAYNVVRATATPAEADFEGETPCLRICSPQKRLPDGGFPISEFCYVDDFSSAAALLALLKNNCAWTTQYETNDPQQSTSGIQGEQSTIDGSTTASNDFLTDARYRIEKSLRDFRGIASEVAIRCSYDKPGGKLRWLTLTFPGLPAIIIDVAKLWPELPNTCVIKETEDDYKAIIKGPIIHKDVPENTAHMTFFNATMEPQQYPTAEIVQGPPAESQEGPSVECEESSTPKIRECPREEAASGRTVLVPLLEKIRALLVNTKLKKLFFDAKPQIKMLHRAFDVEVSQPLVDIMIEAYLLDVGSPAVTHAGNVDATVRRFLQFEMRVAELHRRRISFDKKSLLMDHRLLVARQTSVLLHLRQALAKELLRARLQKVADLENRCLTAVAEMEMNGILFDLSSWNVIKGRVDEETELARARLYTLFDWDPEGLKKLNNPKHVLEALQKRCLSVGETATRKHGSSSDSQADGDRRLHLADTVALVDSVLAMSENTSLNIEPYIFGSPSAEQSSEIAQRGSPAGPQTNSGGVLERTDRQTLKAIQQSDEAVDELLRYRKLHKLQSSFLSVLTDFISPKTGRIHPNFNQIGTHSGRFSCDSPNLQQVPRERNFRACFVASPGRKLIIVDLSQIELRVAADIAPDTKMIQAFAEEKDLHALTASFLRDIPPSDVTKADRQLAKAVNFGLLYGMSARGLQAYAKSGYNVDMSFEDAKYFRSRYFKNYLGIAAWHNRVRHCATSENAHKYEMEGSPYEQTRTRSLRRCWFPDVSSKMYSQLLNYPIQGTAADILKESLVQVLEPLRKLDARLLLCVHDEIVAEAPEDTAEEALHVIKSTMEQSGSKYLVNVACVADGAVGDTWADKP